MTVGYLVDKSALARWDESSVAGVLDPALAFGLLWSCPPVDLEVLFPAQSPAEYFSVRDGRAATYSHAPLIDEIGVTALELQASLARAGVARAGDVAHDLATRPAPAQCQTSRLASKHSRSPAVIGRTTIRRGSPVLAVSIRNYQPRRGL